MSRVEPQPHFSGLASSAAPRADIYAISTLNPAQRTRLEPILPADAYRVARTTAVATVAREELNG